MFVQVKDPLTSRIISIPYNTSWFEKIEPGVYVDGRDNAVVEVGRFGLNAPDKLMRGKPLYVAVIEQKLNIDPPTYYLGHRLSRYSFAGALCSAQSNYANRTWQNCVDSAYGQGEGQCDFSSSAAAQFNFSMCSAAGNFYAPFFVTYESLPTDMFDVITNSSGRIAYSPPCPLADVATVNVPSSVANRVFRMSDNLRVRGISCLDTSVSPAVVRIAYSTQDGIGNSYTVSWVGLAIRSDAGGLDAWTFLQVQQFTKNQNDIYYYIYRLAFNLGGRTAPWVPSTGQTDGSQAI